MLNTLPVDTILRVAFYLRFGDLVRLRQTCKYIKLALKTARQHDVPSLFPLHNLHISLQINTFRYYLKMVQMHESKPRPYEFINFAYPMYEKNGRKFAYHMPYANYEVRACYYWKRPTSFVVDVGDVIDKHLKKYPSLSLRLNKSLFSNGDVNLKVYDCYMMEHRKRLEPTDTQLFHDDEIADLFGQYYEVTDTPVKERIRIMQIYHRFRQAGYNRKRDLVHKWILTNVPHGQYGCGAFKRVRMR